MSTITTDAFHALALVANGSPTARWNFPLAAGTPEATPGGLGMAVNLSYGFHAVAPVADPQPAFLAFTPAQESATRAVLDAYAGVANLGFTETGAVGASLAFANSEQPETQLGFARFPAFAYTLDAGLIDGVAEDPQAGNVWLNRASSTASYAPGTRAYATLQHEVGHALGLKHPFGGGADGFVLPSVQSNLRYTVMAYTPAFDTLVYDISGTADHYSVTTRPIFPSTLMRYDIAALQALYGANTATRSGNDVYRWATHQALLETLWDGGGTDTIDCSNQRLRCEVNLAPGTFSSIALRLNEAEQRAALGLPDWFTQPLDPHTYNGRENLAIADGCWIENATGGSAGDALRGNVRDNLLDGRGGVDTLIGGAGNDRYVVDRAGDRVVELPGQGRDEVLVRASFTLPDNVEQGRIVAAGAVNLTGNGLANLLYAGAGNNVLDGGAGTDTVSYAEASAGVRVSLGIAVAQTTGGSGQDLLKGVESLAGSAHADQLRGNAGGNVLAGGGGNDTLSGDAGRDLLIGGAGSDRLQGGPDADRFRFDVAPGAGNRDRIDDFSPLEDLLQLEHRVFPALGGPGALPAGTLRTGAAALDANDFLLYDRGTGALAYDHDASGPQLPVVFVVLPAGLALHSQHLVLV